MSFNQFPDVSQTVSKEVITPASLAWRRTCAVGSPSNFGITKEPADMKEFTRPNQVHIDVCH